MKHPVHTVRLSQQAKDQLTKLKRYTKLMQWNVLSRWSFCLSLAEPTIPPAMDIPLDSNVEMTWETFGGEHHAIYTALLTQRCHDDGLGTSPDVLSEQFKLHLHRGIAYLASPHRIRDRADLFRELPCVK